VGSQKKTLVEAVNAWRRRSGGQPSSAPLAPTELSRDTEEIETRSKDWLANLLLIML
jgi:hypothetical protein